MRIFELCSQLYGDGMGIEKIHGDGVGMGLIFNTVSLFNMVHGLGESVGEVLLYSSADVLRLNNRAVRSLWRSLVYDNFVVNQV